MGWINDAAATAWWLGRAAGDLFRPRAQNQVVDGLTLEQAIRSSLGGGAADAGIAVTVENAQGLAAVAASVRVLSDSLAHLPLVLYRRNDRRRDPARDLRLYGLLHDRPNEWQTSYQWRKLMERDKLYRGNAYSLIVRDQRGISELIRLHPDQVTPKQDDRTLAINYEYTRPDGRRTTLRREEVLHVWSDSDDGVVGLSPIKVYRQSIGDGIAIRQHGSRFFSSAARLTGVLEMPEGHDMGEEARKALLADFESTYVGNANARRTGLLPAGISFKPVTISMADAEWINARKITAREIFGIFGVPPHKGGDLADATFSNIEHMMLEYLIDTLMPRLVCWEQALVRDLLDGDEGLFVKFNVSGLLRGDAKSRAEALNIQRRAGVINANEWRELEDRNPREDDGGDEYIVEQNMRVQDGATPEETR